MKHKHETSLEDWKWFGHECAKSGEKDASAPHDKSSQEYKYWLLGYNEFFEELYKDE